MSNYTVRKLKIGKTEQLDKLAKAAGELYSHSWRKRMNRKYTAPPWKNIGGYIGTEEDDTQTIAYVSDHRNRKMRSNEEDEANATLIAAAPELLEAAIKLVERIENSVECQELEELKQAIRKAAG